jgi:hypothetical protein
VCQAIASLRCVVLLYVSNSDLPDDGSVIMIRLHEKRKNLEQSEYANVQQDAEIQYYDYYNFQTFKCGVIGLSEVFYSYLK